MMTPCVGHPAVIVVTEFAGRFERRHQFGLACFFRGVAALHLTLCGAAQRHLRVGDMSNQLTKISEWRGGLERVIRIWDLFGCFEDISAHSLVGRSYLGGHGVLRS